MKRIWLGCLFFLAAAWMLRSAVLFTTPSYNVSAEANSLYGILEWSEGKPLYPPRTAIPYSVYLYPPVHAALAKAALWVTGDSNLHARVLLVRSLSFFFLLGACLVLWRGVALPLRISGFAFFSALVLVSPKFADYAFAARNDTLSLFLDSVCLALLLGWESYRASRFLVAFVTVAIVSFWVRQTGLAIFGVGFLTVFFLGERGKAVAMGFTYCAINAWLAFNLFQHFPEVRDHLWLANVRPWRPLGSVLWDRSLLAFVLSYVFFIALVIRRKPKSTEEQITLAASLFSGVLASLLFLRAGGDVNYFFSFLFFLVPAAAFAIDGHIQEGRKWAPLLVGAMAIQTAVSCTFLFLKADSALKTASLPMAEAAERIRSEISPYGFVTGTYAQSLGVYLRGWAIHGPDVTNAGFVAKNGPQELRWILSDLVTQVQKGRISAIIDATPGCAEGKSTALGNWSEAFSRREALYPWLCIYREEETTGRVASLGGVEISLQPTHQAIAEEK